MEILIAAGILVLLDGIFRLIALLLPKSKLKIFSAWLSYLGFIYWMGIGWFLGGIFGEGNLTRIVGIAIGGCIAFFWAKKPKASL